MEGGELGRRGDGERRKEMSGNGVEILINLLLLFSGCHDRIRARKQSMIN